MNDTLDIGLNSSQTVGIIFDGLVAAGTILLAILAIYGERVKRWLFKPKIKVSVNNTPPFVETVQNTNSVSKEISVVESTTSIKVNNLGASPTRH